MRSDPKRITDVTAENPNAEQGQHEETDGGVITQECPYGPAVSGLDERGGYTTK